jgi:hypothetical protein
MQHKHNPLIGVVCKSCIVSNGGSVVVSMSAPVYCFVSSCLYRVTVAHGYQRGPAGVQQVPPRCHRYLPGVTDASKGGIQICSPSVTYVSQMPATCFPDASKKNHIASVRVFLIISPCIFSRIVKTNICLGSHAGVIYLNVLLVGVQPLTDSTHQSADKHASLCETTSSC